MAAWPFGQTARGKEVLGMDLWRSMEGEGGGEQVVEHGRRSSRSSNDSGGVTIREDAGLAPMAMENARRPHQPTGPHSGSSTRSGASENDEFFYPTKEEAKILAQRAGKGKSPANVAEKAQSVRTADRTVNDKDMEIERLRKELVKARMDEAAARHALYTARNAVSNARSEATTTLGWVNSQQYLIQTLESENVTLRTPMMKQRTPSSKQQASVPASLVSPTSFSTVKSQGDPAYTLPSHFGTPVSREKRAMIRGMPDPTDNVFPTPRTPLGPTGLEKKDLADVLSACFVKIEAAVRKVPINMIVPRGRPNRDVTQIIKLLQDHLGNKKLAYTLLKDENDRYWAMIAMTSHTIIDYIFKDELLSKFQGFGTRAYLSAFEAEQAATNVRHPQIEDFAQRNNLARHRANLAYTVVEAPGFWKWVQDFTVWTTEEIANDLSIMVQPQCFEYFKQELWSAVNDSIRVTIRMRQEPVLPEYSFPEAGTPWSSKALVHRNPELVGQTLGDDKSPYCVCVCLTPVIRLKNFENGTVRNDLVRKAEITVGDRKDYLKSGRNRDRW